MRRGITLVAACAGLVLCVGASTPGVGEASAATGQIINLDFGNISGSTVPDGSGSGSTAC